MLGARGWTIKKVNLKRRPQKGKGKKDLKNVGEQRGKQLSHVIPLKARI